MKNLIWFNAVDVDTFYPRCYDCHLEEELDDFISEFKVVKATSYLKRYVRQLREAFDENPNGELKSEVTKKILRISMTVCERRGKDLDEMIDDPNAFGQMVTDAEWKVLGADELNEETLAEKKHKTWMKKSGAEVPKSRQRKKRVKRNRPSTREITMGSEANEEDDEYGIEDHGEEDEGEDEDAER